MYVTVFAIAMPIAYWPGLVSVFPFPNSNQRLYIHFPFFYYIIEVACIFIANKNMLKYESCSLYGTVK